MSQIDNVFDKLSACYTSSCRVYCDEVLHSIVAKSQMGVAFEYVPIRNLKHRINPRLLPVKDRCNEHLILLLLSFDFKKATQDRFLQCYELKIHFYVGHGTYELYDIKCFI